MAGALDQKIIRTIDPSNSGPIHIKYTRQARLLHFHMVSLHPLRTWHGNSTEHFTSLPLLLKRPFTVSWYGQLVPQSGINWCKCESELLRILRREILVLSRSLLELRSQSNGSSKHRSPIDTLHQEHLELFVQINNRRTRSPQSNWQRRLSERGVEDREMRMNNYNSRHNRQECWWMVGV